MTIYRRGNDIKVVGIQLSMLGFQALNWASVMPYLASIVSHWSPDAMRWKPSQLGGMPDWVGSYWEVEVVVVKAVVVIVDVVVAGSSLTVPTIQQLWPAVRVEQEMPMFRAWKFARV